MYQTNQLQQRVSRIFTLMNNFHQTLSQQSEAKELAYQDFRHSIENEFLQLDQHAKAINLDARQLEHTKYALAAYVDELVMTSDWQYRNQWMFKSLQLQFFNEHSAGDGFFLRLSILMQDCKRHIECLDIYFVCLQLGFKGKYRVEGLEKLQALQADLYTKISAVRPIDHNSLMEMGMPVADEIASIKRDMSPLNIVFIAFVILLVAFSLFSIAISYEARRILASIDSQIQSVLL